MVVHVILVGVGSPSSFSSAEGRLEQGIVFAAHLNSEEDAAACQLLTQEYEEQRVGRTTKQAARDERVVAAAGQVVVGNRNVTQEGNKQQEEEEDVRRCGVVTVPETGESPLLEGGAGRVAR